MVGNNSTSTLDKSNFTLEYISDGKPSPFKLIFEVELDFQ